MTESKEILESYLVGIKEWEKKQIRFNLFEKLNKIPSVIMDKITPKFIKEKMELVVNTLAEYIENGGKYLINENKIISLFNQHLKDHKIYSIDEIKDLPIDVMNKVAVDLLKTQKNIATIEGAATGVGGIWTLAIDIPLLLGMSIKILQEIAIAYGYNPNEQQERLYIVKCIQFPSSNVDNKKIIIEQLNKINNEENQEEIISQYRAWKSVIMTYKDNYSWRKLFKIVPLVSILLGAYLNRKTINEMAESGIMFYKKKRITDRLKRQSNNLVSLRKE